MKVLYVTRKFPPSVGGMETAAYELYEEMKQKADVRLIAYGGPNKYLPVVYPWLSMRALFATFVWRPDVIYLQDGVMATMGFMLRLLTRKPVVLSIHGMEMTYDNPVYKAVVKRVMPAAQGVVVGSQPTSELVQAQFPQLPLTKVTYGVRDAFYSDAPASELRASLAAKLGLDAAALEGRKLLVTTGRLVERKGVAWFVEQVMPKLAAANPDVHYLVAGKGPNEEKIRGLIEAKGLQNQVLLLGFIPDEVRDLLYNVADFFVMPNVPVPKDMEGFGLVAAEASSCGTPVIASKLEGIVDAVQDGKTGRLLTPENAEEYVSVLMRELQTLSFTRQDVRKTTLETYSWARAADGYLAVFATAIASKK